MKIQAYLINMKDSVGRRKTALTELSKYPSLHVNLVEAIDGKKLTTEEIEQMFDRRKFLSIMGYDVFPGEIGCTLSHRKCYQKLLKSDDDIALILEDDVYFLADQKITDNILREISSRISATKPCVVTLTRQFIVSSKKEYEIGNYCLQKVINASGTCAYFINKKAAEILLEIPKAYFVADDYRLMNKKGIRVIGIFPMLAMGASEMNEISSEIGIEWTLVKKYPKNIEYSYLIKEFILLILGIWKARTFDFDVGCVSQKTLSRYSYIKEQIKILIKFVK